MKYNNINENKFSEYLNRWLEGIEDELYFWYSVISDNEKWNSHVANRKPQKTTYNSLGIKKILDVGSGPTSIWIPDTDKFIIACDPLAEYYKSMMDIFNRKTIVEPLFCFSERLYEKFQHNTFDIVTMRNALDHSFFPMITIYNLIYVCKIGGKVILRHSKNEALRENYTGFHQFNVDIIDNRAILWNENTNIDVEELIYKIANVSSYKEIINDREFIIIELIKTCDFNILEYTNYNYYLDKYIFMEISQFLSNHAINLINNKLNCKNIEYKKINKNYIFQTSRYFSNNNFELSNSKLDILIYKIDKIIESISWWIPVKKWRDNFREKFKIRTGQDRTGQDRTGQDRTGQDRTGQDTCNV